MFWRHAGKLYWSSGISTPVGDYPDREGATPLLGALIAALLSTAPINSLLTNAIEIQTTFTNFPHYYNSLSQLAQSISSHNYHTSGLEYGSFYKLDAVQKSKRTS